MNGLVLISIQFPKTINTTLYWTLFISQQYGEIRLIKTLYTHNKTNLIKQTINNIAHREHKALN